MASPCSPYDHDTKTVEEFMKEFIHSLRLPMAMQRRGMVIKDLLKEQQTTESLCNRLARVLFYYSCVPHNVTQIDPSVALNRSHLVTLKVRINPLAICL